MTLVAHPLWVGVCRVIAFGSGNIFCQAFGFCSSSAVVESTWVPSDVANVSLVVFLVSRMFGNLFRIAGESRMISGRRVGRHAQRIATLISTVTKRAPLTPVPAPSQGAYPIGPHGVTHR